MGPSCRGKRNFLGKKKAAGMSIEVGSYFYMRIPIDIRERAIGGQFVSNVSFAGKVRALAATERCT